jgi:hypothetical protein
MFVGYMMGEFGLDEATVRRLLETLFELYNRTDMTRATWP